MAWTAPKTHRCFRAVVFDLRNCADSQSIQGEFGYLASGSRDRTVKLWDALQGVCLMTFTAHENWVRCVLFHPSFKYILSCSDDKSIRVMDIKVRRRSGHIH